MNRLITILLAGIFFYLSSCKEKADKNAEQPTGKETEIITDSKLDTLNVDNYNVLFFHPTEAEFQELVKEYGENSGIYEVDSDFGFYTSKVYDSLSKTSLRVEYIEERIIKYSTTKGTRYLDRLKNLEHPYGIIFNSTGCDPWIKFGVMADIGIVQTLNDYNKNCK